jgi:aldose 1-epimerase
LQTPVVAGAAKGVAPNMSMSLGVKRFGDSPAKLYTFVNKNAMKLTVTDIGAAITGIVVPSAKGSIDVALGYGSLEGYKRCSSYYGVTVGRFANRIGGASFALGGEVVRLDANEGKNVLHGGHDPYSSRMWRAEMPRGGESVIFSLRSPDGDQGMPGAADVEVTYSLTDDNRVVIGYRATADKTTVFNLTNHCYFNLDGHDSGLITEQFLQLDCDAFAAIDGELIPTGVLVPVKGTPMDFKAPKRIGRDVDADYGQIELGCGYDHNFVINRPSLEQPFARAWSRASGVEMRVFTDLPGVQFYCGNNMGSDSGEKGGAKYVRRGGFCLETQHFPDSPNQPGFPSAVYEAGKSFESTTIYEFGQLADGTR